MNDGMEITRRLAEDFDSIDKDLMAVCTENGIKGAILITLEAEQVRFRFADTGGDIILMRRIAERVAAALGVPANKKTTH